MRAKQMARPTSAATMKAIAETDIVTRKPSRTGPALARSVRVQSSISVPLQPIADAIDQRRQSEDHDEEGHGGAGIKRERLHLLLADDADLIHDVRHRDHRNESRRLEQ